MEGEISASAWNDQVDDVLAGDLTTALAYATPAGGCVVTPVATVGLRDRTVGTVFFTTSLGFAKKLERIRRDPRVALAYHARDHGFADNAHYVLVQGRASIDPCPDLDLLEGTVRPAAERFLGAAKTGVFWDHWLREYYRERIVVTVDVEQVLDWPGLLSNHAEPGPRLPNPGLRQAPPRQGAAARLDTARASRRLARLRHHLIGYLDGDGFPVVVPVRVTGSADGAVVLAPALPLPVGGRRAGLLGHSYRPQLVGLAVRQHTGWLEVEADPHRVAYFPHTDRAFRAPPNKTLLLLANGFLAKRGARKSRHTKSASRGVRVGEE